MTSHGDSVGLLERLEVPIAQFFIRTPYPGTPQGDTIDAGGGGWWSTLEGFYSLRSIAKCIVSPKIRRGVHPVYFEAG
ncbi:MAG TPA: hypothetical protein VK427_14140 [Kofleriaceae bacterium]|nr:hypothetical protein [Kofleriaceae bacterium]